MARNGWHRFFNLCLMLVKTLDGSALVEKPVPTKNFKYAWLDSYVRIVRDNLEKFGHMQCAPTQKISNIFG